MATTSNQAAEAGSGGMPQLDFATFPNQIFWLVVALVAIYVILSRLALPRIGAILANRRDTILADLRAAEALKQKAAEAERAYHDALDQARLQATRIMAGAKAEIQNDLNAAIVKADVEISSKTTEASKQLDQIRGGAAEAIATVAKNTAKELVLFLGGTADAGSISAAVTAKLKG